MASYLIVTLANGMEEILTPSSHLIRPLPEAGKHWGHLLHPVEKGNDLNNTSHASQKQAVVSPSPPA